MFTAFVVKKVKENEYTTFAVTVHNDDCDKLTDKILANESIIVALFQYDDEKIKYIMKRNTLHANLACKVLMKSLQEYY